MTLSSFPSFFSHSPSSPNHHHDHHHRSLPSISHIHVFSFHLVTTVPLLVFSSCNLSFFISLTIFLYSIKSLRSDESGESEMSSGNEETQLNFDFHGVLMCFRASSLRDEMESSEKRRKEMDLAQRRGRRWSWIQR
ncbi:hypothetical protein IGI04_007652 [Brassica rapa subsp. trilocularis]|uniref:Transmembrane protein n=1 Tax=Brassica rapa subsp. trilocularis TaxID=1813537 RepID=A0ABQ7NKC0_BRACM|nr:hypothetical protein IGI04_007202 [Brassica rapa subsp. trilocularis]KAG5411333.1 hypothetical protein IGI04_007652 [Brassica rapa subsp. trilocularis]